MATCNFIQESKQNPSAMCAVIRYVSQEFKTVDENGRQYLTGINCVGQLAFSEFMATKNLFRKTDGVYFYQYTQSFMPGEIHSYDEAHKVGLQLAEEFFKGYEVLVATHIDANFDGVQRVHNHFIINSVSFEDGRKIHFDNHTLEKMRAVSDRICAEHGLSVLKHYEQTYDHKAVSTREYRAALKGESWKFNLINDIEKAMTMCGSREEFCDLMASAGYTVNWSDSRKYITYTCPNGRKVRDNKLHETKFYKEYMQYEFRIREQNNTGSFTEQTQNLVEIQHPDDNGNALRGDHLCNPEGRLDRISAMGEGSSDLSADTVRNDLGAGDESGDDGTDGGNLECGSEMGNKTEHGSKGIGGEHRSEGAESSDREQKPTLTGWEDAREVYVRSRHGGANAARRIRRPVDENEALDHLDDNRDRWRVGHLKRGDISVDQVKSFFVDEPDDEILNDEDEPDNTPFYTLREQARLGNNYAMYRLSRIYLDEESRFYNPKLGADWLERAAESGNKYAQYRLGKLYFEGAIYYRKADKAEYWLSRSAEQGNPYAEIFLGKAYLAGDFLNLNRKRGIDLLFDAENHGSDYAAYTLGKLYADGNQVHKDIPKAIAHLERAAQMGNLFAEFRLAEIYLFESDVFDWKKAVEYLDISARKGNVYAYNALQKMNQNTMISLTTGISDLVADLTNLFDRREVEDCTTMQTPRREKKNRHDYEQTL